MQADTAILITSKNIASKEFDPFHCMFCSLRIVADGYPVCGTCEGKYVKPKSLTNVPRMGFRG